MNTEFIIVTNNPYFLEYSINNAQVRFKEISSVEILNLSRDLIYKGYTLVTHPFVGGIKPNQTPYKTLVLYEGEGPVDFDSARTIGESILIMEKFLKRKAIPSLTESIKRDLAFIDYTLIKEALDPDICLV